MRTKEKRKRKAGKASSWETGNRRLVELMKFLILRCDYLSAFHADHSNRSKIPESADKSAMGAGCLYLQHGLARTTTRVQRCLDPRGNCCYLGQIRIGEASRTRGLAGGRTCLSASASMRGGIVGLYTVDLRMQIQVVAGDDVGVGVSSRVCWVLTMMVLELPSVSDLQH